MSHHTKTIEELADSFCTSMNSGLSSTEVIARQERGGPNELPPAQKDSLLKKIWHQFRDALVLILIVAAIISFALGDYKDSIVISIIVIANAIIGLLQQAKAENAIAALQKMSESNAKVIRDGDRHVIPARDVVSGDIIVVEAGDKIPADGRVIESVHLRVAEAALTGESKSIEKHTNPVSQENVSLGDRINMVYKDAVVTYGHGKVLVTAIGIETEIGKISQLLQQQKKSLTPLEKELNQVGKVLTKVALISALAIFLSLISFTDIHIKEVFFTAMSIAIAVIPEGIPTVVITVLAIAVTKLAKRNAIIRRLSAVETLGSTSHILTDKTGTLTKNEMTAIEVVVQNKNFSILENGQWVMDKNTVPPLKEKDISWLLTCAILCNDAYLSKDGKILGDPTEASLIQLALQAGINIHTICDQYERVDEIPFSSETKRMIVVVKDSQENYFSISKGAAEVIHGCAKQKDETLLNQASALSQRGVRTLAFSYKSLPNNWKKDKTFDDQITDQHTLIGLIGLKDPLRPGVKLAVEEAAKAGIQTIMITGDHKLIAANIGKELGIIHNDTEVMDGTVLGNATVANIQAMLAEIRVFSRVSPEQKLHIAQAVQANGHIVAVTGDGVNDAPAIKTADIGVAMGISGTDVTKEVADVVLRDDNYATIVDAVHEGRIIFGNFIKFLRYQISCNLSGVCVIFFPTLFGLASPLLPIHILLLNLVSETGPSIALGLEKGEKDAMSKPPRKRAERLLTPIRWKEIIGEAILLAIASLGIFFVGLRWAPAAATTMTLTTAFFSRLWHAFNSRSETHSIFSRSLYRNQSLNAIVGVTLVLFLCAVYTSLGNTYVSTTALSSTLLAACVAFSLVPVIGVELYKVFKKIAYKSV